MNRRAAAVQIAAYAAKEEPGPPERLDPPASTRLREVAIPTLVVVPALDLPDIIGQGDMLADGIPGARKVVMEDVAHFAPMEKPEEFTRLLLDFLP
jgi:pimeloyl-ACP methyl ester carboxylesterase